MLVPMGTIMPNIYVVSMGMGVKEHLTFKACGVLARVDIVYVMAQEKSWMVTFAQDLAPQATLRRYFPKHVKWAQWHNDPVLDLVASEVNTFVTKGKTVAFALAGDCSIYSNFSPLEGRLEALGLEWEMIPGVSFFTALPLALRTVLVSEGESLLMTRVTNCYELEQFVGIVDTLVLYNPNGIPDLSIFIREHGIVYARAVVLGVGGRPGVITDLVQSPNSPLSGLVVIKMPKKAR